MLTGTAPSGSQIVDFVGYGEANASESRPSPALTNTTAAIRGSGGCVDTDDNHADFTTAQPSPRNSRSALAPCFAPATPQIPSAGVTNAASFLPGAIAPGEIITIFGSSLGPEALARLQLTADRQFVAKSVSGTRVLFDGVPAPIIYTTAGQVSAVVPYAVSGRATTDLQVEYNGRTSNRVTLNVAPSSPGICSGSVGNGEGVPPLS